MSPADWTRLRAVVAEVSAAPPEERAALLLRLCGEDVELRGEAESLLAGEAKLASFLHAPLLEQPGELTPSAGWPALLPETIGPYRVRRLLGQGGMGVVYQAEHREYPKTVALKLLRSALDSSLLRRRFRRERDILAALEHPSIARLYGAGTAEDGRPYLAMEYVEGESLLAYADARALSTSDRLRLFLPVCKAVAYAHARQVVHRDLKPSNVLVTAEGVPKLLDFGVAKLLEPATGGGDLTITAAPLMTPEYASPEQVRGEPVGPASDVYSLGVVLYELLTGHRPYRLSGRSAREVERAVCETDPERPSSARWRSSAAALRSRSARRR